ncbi:hypothetical protein N7445_004936 [Penicillium cf. griseofulvum]|nr:hypothetical protein N7445_004936 [Penicillium cf. griseofulvum]
MALKCGGLYSLFKVGYLAMNALNTLQHSSVRQLFLCLFLVYHQSWAARPNDNAPIIERVYHDVLATILCCRRDVPLRGPSFAVVTAGVRGDIKYENLIIFLMVTLRGETAVYLRPNDSATVDYLEISRTKLGRPYYTLKDDAFFVEDQLVKSITDNLPISLSTV